MKTTTHTHGPWKTNPYGLIHSRDDKPLATIYLANSQNEYEANATGVEIENRKR